VQLVIDGLSIWVVQKVGLKSSIVLVVEKVLLIAYADHEKI